MEKNVPANCLGNTISTRCLKWEGPSYPELNIETGDSIEYVLDKIVESLNPSISLEESTNIDLSCLQSEATSSCGAMITQRNLSISKTSATGGVTISWDSTFIKNGLPSGYNIQTATVSIRGRDGSSQFSGGQSTGQIAIPLSAFPITFDYTVYIFTPCGNVRLTTVATVDANPGDETIRLGLIDTPTTTRTVSGYKEAIELLAREICDLKNQS